MSDTMSGFKRLPILLVFLSLVVLGGCEHDGGMLTEPAQQSSVDQETSQFATTTPELPKGVPPSSIDADFIAHNERIPGFGGMYLNSENQLVVRITEEEVSHTSIAHLATTLQENGRSFQSFFEKGNIRERIEVKEAEYSFKVLCEWRSQIFRSSIGNITAYDVDERNNKIFLGTTDLSDADEIKQEVGGLGIPTDAVTVGKAGVVQPHATLQDRVRPMLGGLEIGTDHNGSTGGPCTMGVVAYHDDATINYGFVTAGHCTRNLAEVDTATDYLQPKGSSQIIGKEKFDPGWFSNANCKNANSFSEKCRYSDAAFVEFPSGLLQDIHYAAIAKTTQKGSITMSGNEWTVDDWTNAGVGVTVSKVGRTTGWTQGTVNKTCVHVPWSSAYEKWWLLCQNEVGGTTGFSQGGDSGAAVFTEADGSLVKLAGINQGYDGRNDLWVYSPWSGFIDDLQRVGHGGIQVQD